MGQTSLDNPGGSLFAVDLTVSLLKPIIFNKLAYPCGLAMDAKENNIYVSEMYMNRILRVC
jgi:sugar lactone lactonase YvrE